MTLDDVGKGYCAARAPYHIRGTPSPFGAGTANSSENAVRLPTQRALDLACSLAHAAEQLSHVGDGRAQLAVADLRGQ